MSAYDEMPTAELVALARRSTFHLHEIEGEAS